MTRLMALAVFSGDLNPDPDAAAEELRRAGYTIHRLPSHHPILCHPLDDFIEVTIDAPDDTDKGYRYTVVRSNPSLTATAGCAWKSAV
jgi:hypothetical protein